MNDGTYCELCGAATDRRVRCNDYAACLNRALSNAYETCDTIDAYKEAFIAMTDEVKMAERLGAERERARIVAMMRAEATAMLRHDAQALVLGLADRVECGTT